MSKNDTKSTDLTKAGATPTQMTAAQQLADHAKGLMKLTGVQQLKALEEALGIDAADVEVVAAGSLPFWPAFAGAIVCGTIQGYREVSTKFKTPANPNGNVGIYTLRVERLPCLGGTLDGEVFDVQPGDLVTVLERTVIKELRTRIGQKVAILCMGKKSGRNGFDYWDYKIVGEKRSLEEVRLANELASANIRQLPESTES